MRLSPTFEMDCCQPVDFRAPGISAAHSPNLKDWMVVDAA
jgi:hypothetical protein